MGAFRGDEDLLRRMVINLLDNAIKYTPDGGSVSVKLWREGGGSIYASPTTASASRGSRRARLRAFLPRGQGSFARRGRQRAGAAHREMDRRSASRLRQPGERARTRQFLHCLTARVMNAAFPFIFCSCCIHTISRDERHFLQDCGAGDWPSRCRWRCCLSARRWRKPRSLAG